MKSSGQAGEAAEAVALDYLEGRGLSFVCANWSCKAGEIDLVMQDGPVRVMVEVRLRTYDDYGMGIDSVDVRKQRKLMAATKWYQQKEEWWGDVRFDVVSMSRGDDGSYEIEHVPHAFEALY